MKMDPKLVAGQQAYEVRYFAKKHNLTMDEARAILKKAGSSREKANKLAQQK